MTVAALHVSIIATVSGHDNTSKPMQGTDAAKTMPQNYAAIAEICKLTTPPAYMQCNSSTTITTATSTIHPQL
jgi:hypothetical protein